MLCYRDMSFCADSDQCATVDCYRKLTDKVKQDAEAWWGKPGAPIAVMAFQDDCPAFDPIEEVKDEQ